MISRMFTAAIVALTCAALILCGCNKTSTGTVPNVFSYAITGPGAGVFASDTAWIILSSPDGTVPIAARRLVGHGRVGFGDIGSDHGTVTVLWRYSWGGFDGMTYRNAPLGAWAEYVPEHSGTNDSLGIVDLTLDVPPSQTGFGRLTLSMPYVALDEFSIPPEVSTIHVHGRVFTVPGSGKLSAFCGIGNGGFDTYYGWVFNQRFISGVLNRYEMRVNHPVLVKTVTATKPLTFFDLRVSSDSLSTSTRVFRLDTLNGTTFDVHYPALPASRYELYLERRFPPEYYAFDLSSREIPDVINVPEGAVDAAYNGDSKIFGNVVVTGDASFVEALWTFGGPLLPDNYWQVMVEPGEQSIGLPVIPDSILAAARVDLSTIAGYSIGMVRHNARNYDENIRSEYMPSSTTNTGIWDSYYDYSRHLQPDTLAPRPVQHPGIRRSLASRLSAPMQRGLSR
jgi:hypothetical protein